jgi:hypothetical protein
LTAPIQALGGVLLDPRPLNEGTITWFEYHAPPITHLSGWRATGLPDAFDRSLLPLAVLFLALLVRKLVRSTPADPSRGSGLRGLADRVHALDGELTLNSRPS